VIYLDISIFHILLYSIVTVSSKTCVRFVWQFVNNRNRFVIGAGPNSIYDQSKGSALDW